MPGRPVPQRPGAEPHRRPELQKLLFNCLGCDSSGTILWLIATVRGDITIDEAREWLLGEAGLTRAVGLPDMLAFFDALYTPKTRPPMPVYSPRMLERWRSVPDYIVRERGIPIETCERMDICLDPDGFMGPPEARVRTGPRAVIPHYWDGQLVGWQSRRLPGADPSTPKYLSTPGSPRRDDLRPRVPPERSRRRRVADEPAPPPAPQQHRGHLRRRRHRRADRGAGAGPQEAHLVHGQRHRRMARRRGPDLQRPVLSRRPERASRWCQNWVVQSPFAADPAEMSDELYHVLVTEYVVPWQVWEQPKVLYCHRCFQRAHPGACRG